MNLRKEKVTRIDRTEEVEGDPELSDDDDMEIEMDELWLGALRVEDWGDWIT